MAKRNKESQRQGDGSKQEKHQKIYLPFYILSSFLLSLLLLYVADGHSELMESLKNYYIKYLKNA